MFLLLVSAVFPDAQTPTDSQLLLNEVHQLRKDLSNITVTMQRTQILLYRLQLEEGAISRATQRLDQAKGQLAGVQQRRRNQADEIRSMEAEMEHTQDATQKARLPQMISGLRKEIENWASSEQDAQSRVIEAEQQYRNEQAKRDALEAALEKLDKQLESAVK